MLIYANLCLLYFQNAIVIALVLLGVGTRVYLVTAAVGKSC